MILLSNNLWIATSAWAACILAFVVYIHWGSDNPKHYRSKIWKNVAGFVILGSLAWCCTP